MAAPPAIEENILSMRNFVGFAISTCLACSCLLFASIQTELAQKQNLPQETPTELAKVCSENNPPPCATPPRAISAPSAQFSESGRGKEFNGVCTLGANVEPNGSTSHVHVLRSVGKDLDEKAIKAVKTWKFKPATLNGKPVAVQIVVQVSFHLY
jgi:TonB family protein